jgi:geranylgeranyl reductase
MFLTEESHNERFFLLSAVGTKYKVAVIGGGPSGACAAEELAKNPNIECIMFERKMDNCKPW